MAQFTFSDSTNITDQTPCYIIAEAGVNHNGDIGIAKELIYAAKESEADAVKFQAFIPELLAHTNAPKAGYQKENTGSGSQLSMLQEVALPLKDFEILKNEADTVQIDFICTAFDEQSLINISELEPKCLKWPSGEITNLPLIRKAAKFSIPTIISTGMCNLGEVERAILEFQENGTEELALLHCVSAYPARTGDQNLLAMKKLYDCFNKVVGFSDHTETETAALVAIGLGMKIWEKHITLDKSMTGPDHRASTEPERFSQFIKEIRIAENTLGNGIKVCSDVELDTLKIARKCLAYTRNLRAGAIIKLEDVSGIRATAGIPTNLVDQLIGRKLMYDVNPLDLCSWDQIGV